MRPSFSFQLCFEDENNLIYTDRQGHALCLSAAHNFKPSSWQSALIEHCINETHQFDTLVQLRPRALVTIPALVGTDCIDEGFKLIPVRRPPRLTTTSPLWPVLPHFLDFLPSPGFICDGDIVSPSRLREIPELNPAFSQLDD